MNPSRRKWGRLCLLGTCLFLTALWVFWVPALWAQQAGFPPGGGSYGYSPSGAAPAPTPYLGLPAYNPNASSYLLYPPQSAFFQGMVVPPQQLQRSQSSYGPQQASALPLRQCQYATPISQPPLDIQPPSTIPIGGPWPGVGKLSPAQADLSAMAQSAALVREVPQKPASRKSDVNSASGSFGFQLFSSIEASFNLPLFPGQPARGLRQFGYALFASTISTFAPVEDVPVGPDYILGPGDFLEIRVWGSAQSAMVQNVDRNGEINLPNVGPVRVWGLTFKDAGELIRKQLSRYYRGIKTSITMGRLRVIRVYVVGEVCQPGSYTLSSLSTLTNALFAAGGPIKLGSLRKVQLKRNHHTVGTTDLYDFLLRGDKTGDFRLQSGDTIFVPPIGPIAAITGEVKRPAIYELGGTTRVSDLIEMAGGTTPRSYLKRVQIIRTKLNSEREIIDLDLTTSQSNGISPDIALRDGDLVSIDPTDPRVYNTLRLVGAVKHAGQYEFKPGMRLSDLISRDMVLGEAHLEKVEITRLTNDFKTKILEVNLKDAWAGDESHDIPLKPLDQITLRSEYKKPLTVILSGEVKRPGAYTIKRGEHLSAVLKRAGGFTDKAFLKGVVFTRKSVREAQKKIMGDFFKDQEKRLLAEATQLTQSVTSLSKEEAEINRAVLGQRMELLRLLASKVTLGRVVLHLDDPEKLEGSPDDLALQDGDTIKIPQSPSTVVVMGSVRNPTAVLHQDDGDVRYYLNRAGGLSPEAAKKEIYLLKADGSAIAGFMELRTIDPGDVIIVPPSTEAKLAWASIWKDIAGILGQFGSFAIGVAGVASIF